MTTTFYYKFNIELIRYYNYFLFNKNNKFSYVYFVPINDYLLFVSPCNENIYLTLSSVNPNIKNLYPNIPNIINNNQIKINNIFSIKTEEFKKFIKKSTNYSEFLFELIIKEDKIFGICSVFKYYYSNNTINNSITLSSNNVNFSDYQIKLILKHTIMNDYNFQPIDITKNPLSINYKYYGAISNIISNSNNLVDLMFLKDETSNFYSINMEIKDTPENFLSQVILFNESNDDLANKKTIKQILSIIKD